MLNEHASLGGETIANKTKKVANMMGFILKIKRKACRWILFV